VGENMTKQVNLQVLKPDDPRLRAVSGEVTKKELKDKTFQAVIEMLLDFVYGNNNKRERNKPRTVGLSANQVGFLKRISVVDLAISKKQFSDIHVLINPEIIWRSKSLQEKEEGCVNLPNIFGAVKRSKTVKVRALDRSGNELIIKATRLASYFIST
jgi:peptide deformylase